MALTTAPLLSLDASGSIGKALVFSKWKGRSYVRALVKPANPRSGGQVSMRAMLKFLSQYWTFQSAGAKSSWDNPADARVVSQFNAYVSAGCKKNREFLAPYKNWPQVIGSAVDAIDTFTATAGVREVTIALNQGAPTDPAWGFMLFWSTTTGFTPSFSNLLAVIPAAVTTVVNFVHGPLTADTYYYDAKPFGPEGFIGALDGEISAVIS